MVYAIERYNNFSPCVCAKKKNQKLIKEKKNSGSHCPFWVLFPESGENEEITILEIYESPNMTWKGTAKGALSLSNIFS